MKKELVNMENSAPMKDMPETVKTDSEKLVEFVMSLTDEQVEKLVKRLDLLETLRNMSDNELLYCETFVGKLFGYRGGTATACRRL